MSGLEALLLGDLHDTGVYDLAADLGIVQHGQLPDGSHVGWAHAGSLSPLGLHPPPGLTPPLAAASCPTPPPPLPPPPALRFQPDPRELESADGAVAECLDAAEAAAAALEATSRRLEQTRLSCEPASPARAPRPPGLALTPRAGGTPGRLAAAAQDRLAGEPDGGTDAGGAATPGSSGGGGSKRKRSGSRRAAAAATDGEAAAMAGGGGGGAAAAAAARQGPGKGLRHFSLKVCEKVESKGDTSYEEVANELIADLAAEVAAGLVEQQHDEKNIRRRVYDALNVLEAVGMIDKNKKAIKWKGWPSGLGKSSEEQLQADADRAAQRVEEKRKALEDAVHKAYCLSNLVLRNRETPLQLLLEMRGAGMQVPNPLTLPFMLIQADQDAEVDVQIGQDSLSAHIDFHHHPFTLYDDDHVMRMLSLHVPQPQLYAGLGAAPPLQQEQGLGGGGAPAQQQQQQQQQEQQQEQQQPRLVKVETPAALPGVPPSLLRQRGALPGGPSAPPPPPQQQQQHALTNGVVAPRLTPQKAPAGRLPTPALELSPELGSPTGPLGSGVSAMGLSSPSAAQPRPSGAAAFMRPALRPQLPQLRPALAPAAVNAAGVKQEAFGDALPPPVLAPADAGFGGGAAWADWGAPAAGGAPFHGGPGSSYMPHAAQPQLVPVPQLRPAASDTLHPGAAREQPPQQGVAPPPGGVPLLRPAAR